MDTLRDYYFTSGRDSVVISFESSKAELLGTRRIRRELTRSHQSNITTVLAFDKTSLRIWRVSANLKAEEQHLASIYAEASSTLVGLVTYSLVEPPLCA